MVSAPTAAIRTRRPDIAAMPIDDPAAKILAGIRVLPVLTFDDEASALPTARALSAGGLRTIEVTLRTPGALRAIESIASGLPEVVVGAGTVRRPEDLRAAADAGARFAVSPGLTSRLAGGAATCPLPFVPGVATASEAMAAAEAGFRTLKLFPAETAGGTSLLRALWAPLPELRFCPTGGIGAASFRGYLELPNVLCVGGSWVAPGARIAARDWSAITALAREAAS
jgi:2-dehydro-3-deoxyphosphogluconate aldolase/(4S)-4-hydroxy-2-oxoglutarate aldolase